MIQKLKHFLSLVRFSHTIFALPFALASMLLAAQGLPTWIQFVQIILAMVLCRNAAMAFNRLVDARIDAQNPRTAKRHIPAGVLSKAQVWSFFFINCAFFVAVCWWINSLAFYLSVPTLFVVCFYSLTKRFTAWCHLFLGLAIGISPLGAWVAIKGELAWQPLWMGLALLFWISGFDIIYATQDSEFDKDKGLHSLVVWLGNKKAIVLSALLHLLSLASFAHLGYHAPFHWVYWVAFALIALLLMYLHVFRKSNSLDSLNHDFFLANGAISVLFLLGIAAEVWFFMAA